MEGRIRSKGCAAATRAEKRPQNKAGGGVVYKWQPLYQSAGAEPYGGPGVSIEGSTERGNTPAAGSSVTPMVIKRSTGGQRVVQRR